MAEEELEWDDACEFLYINQDSSIENEDSAMVLRYKMKILPLKND